MVVQLVLTEGIIEDFHMCARTKDYQRFFEDHPKFFSLLAQHVKKVKFEGVNPRQIIAENLKLFLDILDQWNEGRFSLSCDEIYQVEMDFPNFKRRNFHYFTNSPSINSASIKDWNEFYTRYLPDIDGMIREARDQEVIDFKIECKGNLFNNFGSRDSFLNSSGTQWEPQAAPRYLQRTDNTETSVNQSCASEYFEEDAKEDVYTETVNYDLNFTDRFAQSKRNEHILDEISDSEELSHSYSLLDEDSEDNSGNVEQFGPPVPPTKTEPPPIDYNEKLARLEIEFQKKIQAQEEEIEEFEAQSRILKENSETYIQQVESRIQERLKVQEEQIASRENQLKMREDDMDRKVDEVRRREENMDRKMGEMMEMMKMMVGNTAGSKNPGPVQDTIIAASHSGVPERNNNLEFRSFSTNCLELSQNAVQPVQVSTINTPDSGISENNDDIELKVFEVHAFAQPQATLSDFEEHDEREDDHSTQHYELSRNLGPIQDQVTSSSLSHIHTMEQDHDPLDELQNHLEEHESDDNDSIRQMEQKFQRDLASQTQFYEEKLRLIKEQREEMNRKAEEDRNSFYKRYGSPRND